MNDLHSIVGAYVADALDDSENDDFEHHLDDCDECRTEVADLRETMAQLGAFHEVAPPAPLRSSILAAIADTPMLPAVDTAAPESIAAPRSITAPETVAAPETSAAPETVAPLPSNVVAPAHGFGRPRRPVSTWLAAAAAVMVVALGGVTVWQQSELQSVQAADAQRADLLAAPDLVVAPATLEGGALTYLVSKERGEALLTSADLPDPGQDRSWQVWVGQDGEFRSGAVVDAGGRIQTWITGVFGGELLAITNEPRGGSPGPTGEPQAAIEL
ncbi:MAG: anti-sigma factor [Arachnia sp.]